MALTSRRGAAGQQRRRGAACSRDAALGLVCSTTTSRGAPCRALQRQSGGRDGERYSSRARSVLDEHDDEDDQQQQQAPWQQQPYLPNGSSRRTPRPAVNVPPTTRQAPQVPQPVPIIHSSAYQMTLVQTRTMSPSVMNSDDEDLYPVAPASSSSSSSSTSSSQQQAAPSASRAHAPTAARLPTPTPTGTVMVRAGRRAAPRPGAAGSPEPFQGSALEWALHKADASLDELEENPLPLQQAVYNISRGPVGTATSSAVQAAAKLTIKGATEAVRLATPIGKWALQEGAKAAAGLIARAVLHSVNNKPSGNNSNSGNSGNGNKRQQESGGSGGNGGSGTGTAFFRRGTPTAAAQTTPQQQRKGGRPR